VLVLGIESSCDETAVALVNSQKQVINQQIFSQLEEHAKFGGVVPEIAARSHLQKLPQLINVVLAKASCNLSQIDGIAATAGPGLIGGLIIGLMAGKAMAAASKKPFIAVNHLEGHALTARLTNSVEFPYLLLLVSGGHCQILVAQGVGNYQLLGSTIDDAVGEAFDKVAKMLGLGYPGGALVEQKALQGISDKYNFPRPLITSNDCNFSFSGLKTAVKRTIDSIEGIKESDKANICASFQQAVADIIVAKLNRALLNPNLSNTKQIVIAGGVAANRFIYNVIMQKFSHKYEIITPPLKLCTDNAAMIAWAGIERLRLGLVNDLNFEPRARWPLGTQNA
jgi:N6-L-threonylcarbamoyladenine synthase